MKPVRLPNERPRLKTWRISPTGKEVFVEQIVGDRALVVYGDGSQAWLSLETLR